MTPARLVTLFFLVLFALTPERAFSVGKGGASDDKGAMSSSAVSFVYLSSNKNGIYLSLLDEATRSVSAPRLVAGENGSFFLAVHPGLPVLYSLDAAKKLVSAYRIGSDGELSPINSVPSEGAVPCHLAIDAAGRFLVVANYNGGVVSFGLDKEGRLHEAASVFQPTGKGSDHRQQGPHPHGIALSESGDLAYVADLGIDRVLALKVEPSTWALSLDDSRSVSLAPAAGPRHITIHPGGTFAVVVNELDNTVSAFLRDPASGRLTATNTLSTVPPSFTGETWTAEVDFHPNASICYASNRGHSSLALFAFDPATGQLAAPTWLECEGKAQHFAITRSGNAVFIANNDAGTVSLHALDPATGLPGDKAASLPLEAPMCILMVPKP